MPAVTHVQACSRHSRSHSHSKGAACTADSMDGAHLEGKVCGPSQEDLPHRAQRPSFRLPHTDGKARCGASGWPHGLLTSTTKPRCDSVRPAERGADFPRRMLMGVWLHGLEKQSAGELRLYRSAVFLRSSFIVCHSVDGSIPCPKPPHRGSPTLFSRGCVCFVIKLPLVFVQRPEMRSVHACYSLLLAARCLEFCTCISVGKDGGLIGCFVNSSTVLQFVASMACSLHKQRPSYLTDSPMHPIIGWILHKWEEGTGIAPKPCSTFATRYLKQSSRSH